MLLKLCMNKVSNSVSHVLYELHKCSEKHKHLVQNINLWFEASSSLSVEASTS